jgi:hypothetical protein
MTMATVGLPPECVFFGRIFWAGPPNKALMTSAICKYNWLKTKGLWGAKSPDNEKIVMMTTALNVLKGQLKLDPKLSSIVNKGNKKGNNNTAAEMTQFFERKIN